MTSRQIGIFVAALIAPWYAFAVPTAAESLAACKAADAASKRGAFDLAIGYYAECLAQADLQPANQVTALIHRGMVHQQMGNLGPAIADFSTAAALAPADTTSVYFRARARYAQGDMVEAIDDYDLVIAADPTFADAYNDRGLAYAGLADFAAAIVDYDQALMLAPTMIAGYENRAYAFIRTGRYEAAIADFDEVIALDAGNASAYRLRGLAKGVLGRDESGLEDILIGWRLDPSQVGTDQGQLAERGFYDGAVDGVIDAETEDAMRRWLAQMAD